MSKTSSIKSKIQELNQKMEALQAEVQAQSKEYFKDAVQEIFAVFPDIKEFSWTQYTPYFNDGDECVFSVHCDYPKINGFDSYDDKKQVSEAAYLAVQNLISMIDQDVMKSMFGDHVEITVTPTGVSIDEYNHD